MHSLSDEEYRVFQRLISEAQCRSVLEAYSRCVDWKDWQTLTRILEDDAHFDFGIWQGSTKDFLPWVKALEDSYLRRLHLFSAQSISVSDCTATAEVGLVNYLRAADEQGALVDDLLFGRYQFTLTRQEDVWRIQSLTFLLHGCQRFPASDSGDSPMFADGLDSQHPGFSHSRYCS